jgi:hypothetical protein
MRFVIGLLLLALGISMVLKSEQFFQTFGRVNWAEEHLGYSGGSRLFYKLLGILLCFMGIIAATDLLDQFIGATIGAWLVP